MDLNKNAIHPILLTAQNRPRLLFLFCFFSASQDQIARLLSKQADLEREFCTIYFAHKFSENNTTFQPQGLRNEGKFDLTTAVIYQ